jgi:hypothetical protein
MEVMKTPTLILVLGLALVNSGFAVDPPPDGGYPNNNTAEGDSALFNLTTGDNTTAVGYRALYSNTIGVVNTAVGANALMSNVTGSSNTALGGYAMEFSDPGNFNTALGAYVLWFNEGDFNTAAGASALSFNGTGSNNTALGFDAAQTNRTGSSNTAIGSEALRNNTNGNSNTAVGNLALRFSNGHNNTAIGDSAGFYLSGDNNIMIGHEGRQGDNGTIRIGNKKQTQTFISGINGTTVAAGVSVIIDSNGHLGTITSSQRYKDAIRPMNDASEAVLSLKPVTFRYKKDLDPEAIPQFGLVAEDVAKIDPDLVAKDGEGKPYTVRYEAVNAMLLNEFLKEHKKVEELEKQLQQMAARLDAKGL